MVMKIPETDFSQADTHEFVPLTPDDLNLMKQFTGSVAGKLI